MSSNSFPAEHHDFHHLKFNVNYGTSGLLDSWYVGDDNAVEYCGTQLKGEFTQPILHL